MRRGKRGGREGRVPFGGLPFLHLGFLQMRVNHATHYQHEFQPGVAGEA